MARTALMKIWNVELGLAIHILAPNGKYILVACRDENAIEIYEVNRETGMLKDTGKRIYTKAPVCVRWIL